MIKHYIGCDPGKNGGIVVIDNNGNFVSKYIIPKVGDDIDIQSFYQIFEEIKNNAAKINALLHVCIEQVHSIFGTSSKSNFTFGYVVGVLETLVVANKLPYSKIAPKEWQKNIWLQSEIEREPSKKVKNKKGVETIKLGKIKTKVTSLKAAKRLFPNVDLRATDRSRIPHDGLVDSLCIAEACRRLNH